MRKIIADLHLHSRYSRACSKDITIKNLEKWARIKGIDVLGTGDFQHPEWNKELRRELVKEENGIYYTGTGMQFILSTEISLVYTQDGKGRRIHLVVLAPSFDIVDKITAYLLKHGRIDYDGRPIFKIPAWQFVKDLKEISDDIEIIPAHIWTPWFSLFGSRSGFNSLKECFKDQAKHIYAIETGLSSDIEMNDRIKELDNIQKVSFSDSHSFWPWRLGREATIFQLDSLTYRGVITAIRTGRGLWGTIEVDPAYGKYHFDGHRNCNISLTPEETRKHKGLCPVCGRPLTIGVESRVEEVASLASRPKLKRKSQRSYTLIPLHEIIAKIKGINLLSSKRVWDEYWKILKAGKNEFDILLNKTVGELSDVTSKEIAEAIITIREGDYSIKPGYDGVYGEIMFNDEFESKDKNNKNVTRRHKNLKNFF